MSKYADYEDNQNRQDLGKRTMTYDFAEDGGGIGTITPADNITLKPGEALVGYHPGIITDFTSGGSATVEIQDSAGNTVVAADAIADLNSGAAVAAGNPLQFENRTASDLTLRVVVATAALTAGKAEFTFSVMRIRLT